MSARHLVIAAFFGLTALLRAAAPERDVRALLDRYCLQCHEGESPKGDVLLDQLSVHDLAANLKVWQLVLEKIESGEMPPKDKPRPPAEEARAAADWIHAQVTTAQSRQRATDGRVVLRRLNRSEYENTVRDLLGVEVNVRELLPPDSSAAGFDNVGDALHTSSFLLARYLEAAEESLNQAIAHRPQPKVTKKRVSLQKDAYQVKSSTEDVYRKREDGSVVMFSSSPWNAATLFWMEERGRYRFRVSVSGLQSAGQPVVFSAKSGGGMGGPKGQLLGYFDAPPEQASVVEFAAFMEPRMSITLLPYGLATAQSVNKVGAAAWTGPGLVVDWVEMEGPLNETWPPASHERLFAGQKRVTLQDRNHGPRSEVTSDEPPADARRILERFARRAFRRPVAGDELAPFVALVLKRAAEGSSFEQAVRAGLAAVMISPDFLFLREKPGQLDDFALATRLSYFLWSSMPDDELLAVAERGQLAKPDALHAQVERMLKSPKAAAFTENFTGQWLGLREIDFTEPSHILYPEFDDMLKASMLREVHLFFDELLRQDLSLANFLASDFTMLNGRLAKHYGVPGVSGWGFQRVALPPTIHRGGVLTMAAVLKVTANGTNTSPVMRGAWVLDRLLGTPPKPPPADAGTIEPDTRGATTIREQLAKHRRVESCASCHVKIDPPGFALENFDVIGGWREHYRATGNGQPVEFDGRRMPYLRGQPVAAGDVLPDGRKFSNVDEYKQLLLTDTDAFARALTTKLLIYATGGIIEATDRREVVAIVEKARARQLGFRSLIHAIVQSDLFRQK